MDTKTTPPGRKELLDLLPELIAHSPVLEKEKGQKEMLLATYEFLSLEQLLKLYELLKAEEADWRGFLKEGQQQMEETLKVAQNEAKSLKNDVLKASLRSRERSTSEEDRSSAESLLQQYSSPSDA